MKHLSPWPAVWIRIHRLRLANRKPSNFYPTIHTLPTSGNSSTASAPLTIRHHHNNPFPTTGIKICIGQSQLVWWHIYILYVTGDSVEYLSLNETIPFRRLTGTRSTITLRDTQECRWYVGEIPGGDKPPADVQTAYTCPLPCSSALLVVEGVH